MTAYVGVAQTWLGAGMVLALVVAVRAVVISFPVACEGRCTMAGSLNRASLIGHLGGDPEIRHAADGCGWATLSIATSESWRDKTSGERKEKTEWHRVVVFNEGLVKVCEQYLKKGAKVFVEGQLRTRQWKDDKGVERWSTEIVLSAFNSTLLMLDRAGGKRPPDAKDGDYGELPGEAAKGPPAQPTRKADLNDEIPF